MGELARQPGAPKLAETPLELLTPKPHQVIPAFETYRYRVIGAGTGIATAFFSNILLKRPTWAGIQNHFILGICGYFIGSYLYNLRMEYLSEKEAMLRNYISLHPDDFPPFERKRIGELFVNWTPIR